MSESRPVILTIGHSNRTLEELIRLLQAHHITQLVDVRTVPRSRHNPQFNRDTLPDDLRPIEIDYHHMPGLGGLRYPHPDSPNAGWQNTSFRGFADYMQTPAFAESLEQLMALAAQRRVALMCAEAVPWRCHRSLIGDALTVRGYPVEHILSATRTQTHKLTPFAHVEGMRITYPPEIMAQ
jgi:uncharacterized protein (DUF488 family)